MLKLHLIRHAKTEKTSVEGTDFSRKLQTKGRLQSEKLGQFLNQNRMTNIDVYYSPAQRTKETLAIILENHNFEKCIPVEDFYLAEKEVYLEFIHQIKNDHEILILSHNDGLSELASYFCDDYIHLSTSAYICISFPFDEWNLVSRATGTIASFYRPQVLL